MLDKFAGVGLKNVILIWLLCVVFTVMAKVILAKHPVPGISEVIHSV
jgi:hypothetical protein